VQTDYHHLSIFIDIPTTQVKTAVSKEFKILSRQLGFMLPEITFQVYSHDLKNKLRRVIRTFD